jgi:predicted acetyltransferase
MSIAVRTCTPEDYTGGLAPIWHYFGRLVSEEDAERMARVLPPERVHAAFDDGVAVGGAGAYLFDLTVPGGSVPTAGVVAVGVMPTHRRRGILSELMRRQLEDTHERGEPLALLYASEGSIYRRYGYGVASISGDIAIPTAHASLYDAGDPAGRARMVSQDEALEAFPVVYDRAREETPGMFTRTRDWWEVRRLSTGPWAKGDQMRVLIEVDGAPEAYATYRIEFEMEHGVSHSVLRVGEAIGSTPAGTREIWRFLLNMDWMETIHAVFLPPDHPLFLLLTEPRRMGWVAAEALWARLVDVGAALSARSYGDDSVVLEVEDSFCPWNEGRWRVEPGGAERTDRDAELRLGVDALGSVYLGGFTFADLARAARVEELAEGAVARADRLFVADRHPWCPEIF